MKLLKIILICLILICILLFVLNMTIAKNLIIIEYFNTYLICAIMVFMLFLLCLIIIKNKKEIFSVTAITICVLISFSTCFTMIGISHRVHKNPQYMLVSSGLINPLNEAKLNDCGLLYHSVPSNDISPVS